VPVDIEHERTSIPPPSKERRWDIDERGEGIGDASAEARRVDDLRAHAERPGWVTEEPEAHLWPHLERAIQEPGSPWVSADHAIDRDGRLIVDLVHAPAEGDRARAGVQADVLRLVGLVIEGATFVEIEERGLDDTHVIDVVTGMLDDQTPFKAHGHTLRFRVTTAG
jgi:hypothetical protein